MNEESKKKSIASLLEKGILVSPDFIDGANLELAATPGVLVLTKESGKLLSEDGKGVNWEDIDKVRVLFEKGKASLPSIEEITAVKTGKSDESVKIISSYESQPQKIGVQDFSAYFNTRYKLIERLLSSRRELQNLTSISKIKTKTNPDNVSIIGMVSEKQETKNKNIMLSVEDSTGTIRVLVNRSKEDLFKAAQDVVTDEVIGITGAYKNGFLFTYSIVPPDIPNLELKKSPKEEYAAFMSDLHFGSKQFMEEEFKKFLSWLNLETGTQKQKAISEKLKYIMVAGDVVDGVGVYQDQQAELSIKDVKKQYQECADYLSQVPKHIKIIMAPGNHDAVRASEPQPPLVNEFATPLSGLKNITLISNPATFTIGACEGFQGFNVLMYHGYSFDHYVANVDSIRMNGGYDRADLIMKFLLKKRHLAPTHASTIVNPTPNSDGLFIGTVPDFFVTGHIHRTSVSQYKSASLINSSCWQSTTSFQERLGHNPQPARLPLVNLKTRDTTIINFNK